MTWKTHLRKAIEVCGGQASLANKIGKSQQHISFLLSTGKNISGEIAVAVERATEGEVTRGDLRPDLFPSEAA